MTFLSFIVIQKYPSCPLSGSMCPATAFPTCPCATATCGISRASRWTTTPCKCHPRRSARRANTTSSSTSTWRPARGARRNWKDTWGQRDSTAGEEDGRDGGGGAEFLEYQQFGVFFREDIQAFEVSFRGVLEMFPVSMWRKFIWWLFYSTLWKKANRFTTKKQKKVPQNKSLSPHVQGIWHQAWGVSERQWNQNERRISLIKSINYQFNLLQLMAGGTRRQIMIIIVN